MSYMAGLWSQPLAFSKLYGRAGARARVQQYVISSRSLSQIVQRESCNQWERLSIVIVWVAPTL